MTDLPRHWHAKNEPLVCRSHESFCSSPTFVKERTAQPSFAQYLLLSTMKREFLRSPHRHNIGTKRIGNHAQIGARRDNTQGIRGSLGVQRKPLAVLFWEPISQAHSCVGYADVINQAKLGGFTTSAAGTPFLSALPGGA